MIRNYIKLAWRSMANNKVFSFINVFGLAIGLTCCMLIALFIYHEFSYDAHQQQAGRLYQVATLAMEDGKEERRATTTAPMAPAMQQEFPEIEKTVRLVKTFEDDKTLFQYQHDKKDIRSFYETNGYLADSTFFHMFSYNFKEGDARTALLQPNSVVISEEIAQKIFGKEPALNKVIHINSTTNGAFDYKVTGVFVPAATPSHIDARFIMSMQGGAVGQWVRNLTGMLNNNMFYSYLLLKPGADAEKLQAKFDAFMKQHAGDEMKSSGRQRKHFLVPVRDIHLHANTSGNASAPGNLNYLYILSSIALVTLLIACVNFMNLSTARSSKRAVEIGVRKVLGAEKSTLIRQFLWEAVLLSLIAFLISLLLSALLMPLFEQVSGKSFDFSQTQYGYLLAGFFIVSLVAGLIAGIYPAFYLSAFKPVRVLKGKFSNSLAAISFRRVLVVFQFVISVALIVASVTISNQMRYLRSKDLGFQKDQQLVIPLRTTTARSVYPALKNEVLAQPFISGAGGSNFYPGIANTTDWLLYKEGKSINETKQVYMNWVDDTYLQTLGVKPVAGRLFSKDFPGDTANRIILNEQAVKEFGFASNNDALGKHVIAEWGTEIVRFQVVGIVNDFHFKDLHLKIEPYGFLLNSQPYYTYMVTHVNGSDVGAAIDVIRASWTKLNPNEPFEYSFLDQDFAKNYVAEDRLAAIIRYFTIIAIFISCLGLFGLTTFSVEQRTKEIGIRKVLGASTAGIVSLLSKDFIRLVLISFLIASPLAWYFINQWLQGFAYRAPFSIWIILLGCGIALLIAFLTISVQAVKAALANPVKNLRME